MRWDRTILWFRLMVDTVAARPVIVLLVPVFAQRTTCRSQPGRSLHHPPLPQYRSQGRYSEQPCSVNGVARYEWHGMNWCIMVPKCKWCASVRRCARRIRAGACKRRTRGCAAHYHYTVNSLRTLRRLSPFVSHGPGQRLRMGTCSQRAPSIALSAFCSFPLRTETPVVLRWSRPVHRGWQHGGGGAALQTKLSLSSHHCHVRAIEPCYTA